MVWNLLPASKLEIVSIQISQKLLMFSEPKIELIISTKEKSVLRQRST